MTTKTKTTIASVGTALALLGGIGSAYYTQVEEEHRQIGELSSTDKVAAATITKHTGWIDPDGNVMGKLDDGFASYDENGECKYFLHIPTSKYDRLFSWINFLPAEATTTNTEGCIIAVQKGETFMFKPHFEEFGIAYLPDVGVVTNLIHVREHEVTREYRHDIAVTNISLSSGEMFEGLALASTNLNNILPVIGETPALRVYAPHQQGWYTTGYFSAIEIGDYYQMLFAQRMMTGSAAYYPNPSSIRFYDDLTTNELDTCKSLQDYLDAASPDTVREMLEGYVPVVGDAAIDGSLRVTGTLASEGTLQITNANIVAKKFSVVDGDLTAVGLTVTNGFCNLQAANVKKGLSSPRVHITTDSLAGYSCLTNITFGRDWRNPSHNLYGIVITNINNSAATAARNKVAEHLEAYWGAIKASLVHDSVQSAGIAVAVNYELTVLNNETFPFSSATNRVQFPPAFNSGITPTRFELLIDYSRNMPIFKFDSENFWTILSDREDVFEFTNGVPSLLKFQQIGDTKLIVTRKDFIYDAKYVATEETVDEN